MVQFDEAGKIFKPGFITQSDLKEVEMSGFASVYMPHSYNFSGNILVVKNELVTNSFFTTRMFPEKL